MADNAAAGPGGPDVLDPQHGDAPGVRAPRVHRELTPRPSDEALNVVPEALETPPLITGHNDYTNVLGAFYDTLEIVDMGPADNPVRYIKTNFITCNQANFNTLKNASPHLGNLRQDVHSLFKIINMILHPPRGMQHAPLTNRMGVADINGVLATSFTHDQVVGAAGFQVNVFRLWLRKVLTSVVYVHRKAKMGLFLYSRIMNLGTLVRELKNDYQRLLSSLSHRQEVNDLAVFTSEQLQYSLEEARAYAQLKNERCVLDAVIFLPGYINSNNFLIQGQPNGLGAVAARHGWFEIHHYKPDLDPLTEPPLSEYSQALEPILSGIRTFTPSPRECAEEEARNLRPSALTLGRDITNFLSLESESKSLGAAKSLKASLNNMRTILENLVPRGVILDQVTTGLSAIDLSNYSTDLDDFIVKRESDIRKEENQSRIEAQELSKSAPTLKLPELSGFSSWLSWKAQADQLLPLHKSDLIKRQIIKASLRNKEDQIRCKDIGFKEILVYLEARYSSPFLVPQMIEECLKLRRPNNDRQSYENLTSFVSLLNQLRAHKQEDKLNMHVRQRLAPILLHSVNLTLFYRDVNKHEQELKSRQDQSDDVQDGASLVSYALGESCEEERRKYWISEMLTYLSVARKIVSQEKPETDRYKHNNNNRNYSVQQPTCPVCKQNHVNKSGVRMTALSKCQQWCSLPVKERYRTVKQFSHCVKCTRPRSEAGHVGSSCSVAEQQGLQCNVCQPASKTHHQLLHDPDLIKPANTSKPGKGRGGGGGGPRGRGGGGRGGQRGRGRGGNSGRNNTFYAGGSGSGETEQSRDTGQGQSRDGENQDDNDDQYEYHDMEPFTPVSRDTLLASAGNFKAKHLNKFSLDSARLFLTCMSLVTIKCGSYTASGCALLDSGSSLGYTSLEFAKKHRMKQEGTWQGVVQTIHGSKPAEHPIFIANLQDAEGEIYKIKLLGTKRIGYKNRLPDQLFYDLCNDFKVSQSSVQQFHGPVDLLLGLDCNSLLATRHLELSCERHPELFLCSTPLHNRYFFSGAVGRDMLSSEALRTLTFKSDILCFYATQAQEVCHKGSIQVSHDDNIQNAGIWKIWTYISRPLKIFRALTAIIATNVISIMPGMASGASTVDSQVRIIDKQNMSLFKDVTPGHLLANSQTQTFISKSSSVCDRLEETAALPSIHCLDCSKRMLNCKICRYLNSQISLNDLRELQIIRSLIQVRQNPKDPSKKQIYTEYPWTVDVNVAFHYKNSNMEVAKRNSERLRQRLMRIGLHTKFDDEMKKVIEQGHARVRDDYTPTLTPQNFVFINYCEKGNSWSQSIRPVSNSGAKNKIGLDLNNSTFSGPNFLTSGLQCMLAFRLRGGSGYAADLSRAYRSVVSSPTTNQLRLFWWFEQIDDPTTLKVYSYEVMNFGDRPSACTLEVALREYLAPAASTEEVRTCIESSRLVDDFVGSLEDPSRIPAIREDLQKTTEAFSFKLKSFNFTGQSSEDGSDLIINVLGLKWNCTSDEMTLQTAYYCGAKRRGRQLGDEMTVAEIEKIPITKSLLAKILGMTFSYDSVLLGPIIATLRILFSKSCKVLKDWESDLQTQDGELASEARQVLCSLVNIKDRIKPLKRELIPQGYTLRKVVISSDAGLHCFCFLVYFISEDDKGNTASRLVISKPKIHSYTVPIAEFLALASGVRFLAMDLFNLIPQLKDEVTKNGLMIVFQTDSMCTASSLSPTKIHKDVKVRNLNILTYRCAGEMVSMYPRVTMSFTHSKSASVVADTCTKLSLDSIEIANSDFYRMGPTLWQEKSWPEEQSIFLRFKNNEEVYFTSPRSEQSLSLCSQCYMSEDFCFNNSQLRSRPPTVAVKQNKTFIKMGYLDKSRYSKLLLNCSSLRKVINIVILLVCLFRKGAVCGQQEAFLILINSHQMHFPGDKNTTLQPYKDKYGMCRARLRLTESDGTVLDMDHHPLIVSHHDHRLVYLLIDHAHRVNIHLSNSAHLNATLTMARLRQNPFSVHLTRAAVCVRRFLQSCSVCLKYLGEPDKVPLGSPRIIRHLKQYNYVWSLVSLDQLGPYEKSPYKGSRKKIKYYILVLVCCVTGATNAEILEDNTRKSITAALYLHSQRFVRPDVVICDKSTSVNVQPGSETYKYYFDNHPMQILQLEASHQQLNNVEATIKQIKKVIRTALLTRANVRLPSLSYSSVKCLLESVCFLFNSRIIPITHNEESFLTPLHLFKLDWFSTKGENNLNQMPSVFQLEQNLNLLRTQLGDAVQIFHRMLKQILISNPKRHLRRNAQSNAFMPGDVCIFLKTSGYKLVRILSVEPQYCQAVTSDQSRIKIHSSLLVLIHRSNENTRAFTDMMMRPDSGPEESNSNENENQNIFFIDYANSCFLSSLRLGSGQFCQSRSEPAPVPASPPLCRPGEPSQGEVSGCNSQHQGSGQEHVDTPNITHITHYYNPAKFSVFLCPGPKEFCNSLKQL